MEVKYKLMVMLYSLERIAEMENTTSNNLRVILHRLQKKGKALEWRGWKFFNLQGKAWFGAGIDEDVVLAE